MKAFVTVLVAFTALSATLAEDSDRTEKRSTDSTEHERHFPSYNTHAQQQQFDFYQPHQVQQHYQLNQAGKYYQHIQQQQPDWESQKHHAPDHQYQHVENQHAQNHYAQDQHQHHEYQTHQAQYQPLYQHQLQEQHPHHHGLQHSQPSWNQQKLTAILEHQHAQNQYTQDQDQQQHHEYLTHQQQHQLQEQHPQHPQLSWNQQKQTAVVPHPVQPQKQIVVPVNYPHPESYEKSSPQETAYKTSVFEEKRIPYQVDRPVQSPLQRPIPVIRISKPVAVHVDKPYPMYMEHPVYRETPVPMTMIIIKEKNKSLWG